MDYLLFDIWCGIDRDICLCGVTGRKSINAIKHLASPTVRKVDVVFRTWVWCVFRVNYFGIQPLLSTNIWCISHNGISARLYANLDYIILYSAIHLGSVDKCCCGIYSPSCAWEYTIVNRFVVLCDCRPSWSLATAQSNLLGNVIPCNA